MKKVKPSYVVLVHGSAKNADALRQYLDQTFPDIKEVCCPKNEEVCDFDIEIAERFLLAGELKEKIENSLKVPPKK